MLRRFGEFFAGAKTPHYDFDEVIVSADCILEFTGCMNEDSEEKEIFILLKLFHVCEFEKTCVDVCINKQV